jgi:hypothetical protein
MLALRPFAAMPSSRDTVRRRAGVASAVRDGWRRVWGAPAVSLGALAATWLLALPLALSGPPMIGQPPAPEILGFGGPTALAADILAGGTGPRGALAPPRRGPLQGLAAFTLLGWLFLWGGILERLARDRPLGAAAFVAAGGAYFFRFLRLAVPIGLAYALVLGRLPPWPSGTPSVTEAAFAAVGLGALALVRLASDLAQVRAVVEDRRSMIGALLAGLRFARRRPLRVLSLYGVHALSLAAVAGMWVAAAPGGPAPGAAGLVLAHLYVFGRVWVRLALAASLVAFFQRELARPGYAAAGRQMGPVSPAAAAGGETAR